MNKTKERNTTEIVVRPNTYATLLVHAEPGKAASARVEAAACLARDLGARLIGLGAETFEPAPTVDPFMSMAGGQWVSLVQENIEKNLLEAEAAFRRDAAGADIEWRTANDYPHRALIGLARAADLIVVSRTSDAGRMRSADPADVVMTAGRPVLMVPDGGSRHLRGERVVVAFKDTPECRRAISAALPFLQRASDVIVLAVEGPDAGEAAAVAAADVVANLKRHGVDARSQVSAIPPEGVTCEIEKVARLSGADLIVCGAYGHSRLREWVMGGVSADLLHRPECFVLMSH